MLGSCFTFIMYVYVCVYPLLVGGGVSTYLIYTLPLVLKKFTLYYTYIYNHALNLIKERKKYKFCKCRLFTQKKREDRKRQ